MASHTKQNIPGLDSHASATLKILLATLACTACFGCGSARLPERALWYDRPAAAFEEGLPLGNGRIGATVYGGAGSEHILLNEETLWAGGPVDPEMNPEAYIHLPSVRQALFAGDYEAADRLVRKIQGKFSESFAPLGDLYIDMGHGSDFSEYRRELDIRRALASVTYMVDGIRYGREILVSHPDQVMAIRLTANKKGALGFSLRQSSPLRYRVRTQDSRVILDGTAPVHAEPSYRGDMPNAIVYDEESGMRFRVIAQVVSTDGSISAHSDRLAVSDASEAVILLAIATSFNGFDKNPGTEGRDERILAAQRLSEAASRSFDAIKRDHVSDFRGHFDRVVLNLGDAPAPVLPTDARLKRYTDGARDNDLEALYFQYGRYLLISCSRPGGIPANLQGIWNPHMRPPWSSNYTTNINAEMNYWPAEVTNLSEMHEPLLAFISNLAKTGEVTAKTFFDCGGWTCCHNTDIWAMTNPVGDFGKGHPVWANWNMGGAWLATHLWEHFDFTHDTAWLADYAYPLMKGAARFCLDWLVEDGRGHLVTAPSTSPENLYKTDTGYVGATAVGMTADMAMIRELFEKTIEATLILDVDADLRKEMQAASARLYPYQIGSKGHLQEWYHDWEDRDPHHRHVSHLFGLYPGHQITPEGTPELADAARRSLELRGDGGTGWSKAWKIALWARLGDGDRAHKLLRTHLTYTSPDPKTEYRGGGTYPNLWDAHPPFQIDGNFGGTAGIAEMLLQSRAGRIILLPALPSGWPQGEVRGLRARGGFEVDLKWEAGRLIQAVIRSQQGGSCEVVYGGRSRKIEIASDASIRLDGRLD
jgi:alpha-L-fucosidase 2